MKVHVWPQLENRRRRLLKLACKRQLQGEAYINILILCSKSSNVKFRKRERASDQQTEHDLKMPSWTCVIFKVIARDSTLAQLDTVRLYSIQDGLVIRMRILTIAITGGL